MLCRGVASVVSEEIGALPIGIQVVENFSVSLLSHIKPTPDVSDAGKHLWSLMSPVSYPVSTYLCGF